jgi:undecaprenyl-diphosphatase
MRRLWNHLTTLWDKLDGAILLGMSVLLVAGYVLVQTIDEVIEGESDWVDHAIVRMIASLDSPKWFEEIMRDCTAFGGTFVLSMVTIAVGVFLIIRKQYHALVFVLMAVVGATILSLSLKGFFHRDRPMILEHRSHTMTSSFPSGHAMLSAAVWLTLAVLLSRLDKSPFMKGYFIAVGLFISFMTGVSRVWLGVHWPTDVLAGWMAGSIWAVLCFFFIRYLQSRGKVEPPSETMAVPKT